MLRKHAVCGLVAACSAVCGAHALAASPPEPLSPSSNGTYILKAGDVVGMKTPGGGGYGPGKAKSRKHDMRS